MSIFTKNNLKIWIFKNSILIINKIIEDLDFTQTKDETINAIRNALDWLGEPNPLLKQHSAKLIWLSQNDIKTFFVLKAFWLFLVYSWILFVVKRFKEAQS